MRKLATVFTVLMLTIPLTGCWDRREVSELALVMAKAIDLTPDNKIRVSVQIAIPSKLGSGQSGGGGGGGGSKSFFVVSADGRTVSEADNRIQQRLSRELYLAHLRIILVSEKVARTGMGDILDHFGRNPPNRLRAVILIAKDSDAQNYLTTSYPLERLSGEAIRKMERRYMGTTTTLMDYMIQTASDGVDPTASAVSLTSGSHQGDGGETSGGGSSGSSQSSGQSGQDTSSGADPKQKEESYYEFSQTALFRSLKLVGYLSDDQAIVLQWINSHLRHGTLTVPVNMPSTASGGRRSNTGTSTGGTQEAGSGSSEGRSGNSSRYTVEEGKDDGNASGSQGGNGSSEGKTQETVNRNTISVNLTQLRCRSRLTIKGNHILVRYDLSGSALLTENSLGLDADSPVIIRLFRRALNQYVQKTAINCLKTSNQTYDSDATGVGRLIHNQHPYDWVKWKDNWHKVLPTVQYQVVSHVRIMESGKSGPPMFQPVHRGIVNRDGGLDTSGQNGGGGT